MQTIVAAVDFSAATTGVIHLAADLAEACRAALWLLHVAAPDPDFVGYDRGTQSVRTQVASDLRDTHRRLQDAAEQLRARGLEVTALQIQGATAETILHEAARLHADLIVLGSHGHGALHRALLGSVSEAVLHAATRPVLILPARGSDG